MPLEILGPLVVCGIAVMVAVVHLSGVSKTAKLRNFRTFSQAFLAKNPDSVVEKCMISTDGSAGFAILAGGNAGLVEAMGDRFLIRQLSKGDVSSVIKPSQLELDVTYPDFTHNRRRYEFGDIETLQNVESLLTSLIVQVNPSEEAA